jgi:hypothetical protein
VDFGGRDRRQGSPAAVLASLVLAAGLLGLWLYVLFAVMHAGLLALVGTAVYLLVAYVVHPHPELANVGWLGGLFDHPFRYSDDVNRLLVFLVVVLWPGRFVAESLVATARLLARTWRS